MNHKYSTYGIIGFMIFSSILFVAATTSTESYTINTNETGTKGFYVTSYGYSTNPILSLRNFNQSEKGLNMIVYARNFTGTIANYSKNESVYIWSYGAPLLLGSSSTHDLVFTTNDTKALTINGSTQKITFTQNLVANDGSEGYTGNCSTTLVIKQGIVTGCV